MLGSIGTFDALRSSWANHIYKVSVKNNYLMDRTNKVLKTYNSAADSFDMKPLGFWSFFGQQTVKNARLKSGNSVLDVCCGSGASALPAAKAVGKEGLVIGVDIADKLLELAQKKALTEKLEQLYFLKADMEQIQFSKHKFNAVICVFGIFFFEDMERQLARLWDLVKPSGKLAITTWGQDIFSPASQIWEEELSEIREDLLSGFNPWDEITTTEGLSDLFSRANIPNVQIEHIEREQSLPKPEDFWTIAMGSGFRWVIEQLSKEERALLKDRLLSKITKEKISSIKTNALIAVAIRG